MIHELFHSFNKFAGFGGQNEGTLFDRPEIIQWLRNNPDVLKSDQVSRESLSMLDTELLADLGLFASYGLIDDDEIIAAFQVAGRQARLYHTSIDDYASIIGGETQVAHLIDSSISDTLGTRNETNEDGQVVWRTQGAVSMPINAQVIILARSDELESDNPTYRGNYLYVGYKEDIDGQSVYRYGWFHESFIADFDSDSEGFQNLPILTLPETRPNRPFSLDDPLNP